MSTDPAEVVENLQNLYGRALDEIWHLRRALAYEAATTEAHLGYKTFPKSRREIAERQIERMRASARGDVMAAYADTYSASLDYGMAAAGAKQSLTRHQWEQERPR